MSLVANGYSESKIESTLNSLGLDYSKQHMEIIKQDLLERLKDFKTRELPSDIAILYIDAYHCEIREKGKVRKSAVYIALGIDLQGNKDILGFYTFFNNENRADWLKVFNDLTERGVKRVMIVVSDDFPGIANAIEKFFPDTDHQLCFIHLQRNVTAQMSKQDAQFFKKELKNIKNNSLDFEDGLEKFGALCEKFKSIYPSFIKRIQANKERYLCFLKYPENLRKHIYTTNPVESINSMIEGARINLGGYFQSVEILEINILVRRDILKNNKWSKPVPALKGSSYEVLQIFNRRFCYETQNY
jgi:putative transposase